MNQTVTGDRFMKVGVDGFVSADDVLFLRQEVFKDGVISKTELNTLLGLAERAPNGDPEWAEFFGEASADYYLREEIPHDYITEREFTELHMQVTRFSNTVTPLVLSMLIKLLHNATATPPAMSTFIADQIRQSILEREGDPIINRTDVNLIRRFLFAKGGDGNIAVTQAEAALLFDINDMTICLQNDPAWSDLFVKAITNHLMGHIGYVAPSREKALEQFQWVSDNDVDIAGFFKRMVSGGLAAMRNVYKPVADDETPPENIFEQVAKTRIIQSVDAENLAEHEVDWLAERIGRDGIMDDNERALVAYMCELDAPLPASLQELIGQVA